MSNREWEDINDRDFEAMLERSISELPPEDIVDEVTPWKKSMNRILMGMALNAITLNFWCLNYILPAIGMVLMLLGFRALRQENKWFGRCYVISIIRVAYFFTLLIFNTTIIQSIVDTSAIGLVLTIANLLLLFIEFICLWRGFLSVQEKAGLSPHAGGAVALILWYALVCLLGLVQYSGWIIGVAIIVGYGFIIHSLYKLSKELDEAGYAIKAAPIKVSDGGVVISLVSLLVIGCTCGYVFGGSYPMEWSALKVDEHNEVEDIKEHLTDMGFPEHILEDLSAEDIAACEGALRVVVDVTDLPVNDGREEITEYDSEGVHHYIYNTVYDVKELRITGVGVQLPGERESWVIFHHFLWTTDPGFYGTESIQLWPASGHFDGDVSGRVLYDNDGETFVADYYNLGTQTYTSNNIFWENQSTTDVFATFSMPRQGENYRGYVAYTVDEAIDGYIIYSGFNYTHQRSWLQYPVVTAMENQMTGSWTDDLVFKTIQDDLSFYPTEDEAELID